MNKKHISIKNEDGAVAVLFSILVSSGLVIGLFVMVFDVGSLYSERRVIQNAADSSVLATAQECALDGTGAILNVTGAYPGSVCGTQSYTLDFATKYANLNSPDSLTNVSETCGRAYLSSINLGTCNALNNGQYECKSVSSDYKNFVRVKTSTLQTSGTSIKSLFTSPSNPSNAEVTVVGCAQSAWGKAGYAPISFPFALPICDYQISGTKLIQDFSSNDPVVPGGCSITDLNGDIFPYINPPPTKGFSLLSELGCPGITVPTNVNVGDVLRIESSFTQMAQQCPSGQNQFLTQLATFVNKSIFVPVVTSVFCESTSVNCQGNYTFRVASFYSLKFLGAKFKNQGSVGSGPNSVWPSACDSTSNCLYGTFERAIVPGADVSLDPNFPAVGAMAVQLLP
jgi:Flp pilus assembly protein TadG